MRTNAIMASLGCWHVSFLTVVKGFFLVRVSSLMPYAAVVVGGGGGGRRGGVYKD